MTRKKNNISPNIMALIMLAILVVNTAFISPLLTLAIEKTSISNSHIISIMFYTQIFIPMIAAFIGYAFIIRKIITSSLHDALAHIILYQAATLASVAFSAFWSVLRDGALPGNDEFFYLILTLFLNYLLSCALMYAVAFAANAIKKRAKTELPTKLIQEGNAFLISAFVAALIESVKQLIIELSYIIPTIIDIGSDLSLTESVSMLISIIFCVFVFAAGYLIIASVMLNKKIQ